MTNEEMQAKVNALRGVNTIEDWYTKLAPKYVSRYAKPSNDRVAQTIMSASGMRPSLPGKLMSARFDGKCVDCGGWISAGSQIRYDGKVHHADPMECDRVNGERDSFESDAAAERRNEAWFEERGHMPSMDEQIEEDRDRYFDFLQQQADRDDQDRADAHSLARDLPSVKDGTYTVVSPTGYRTLKVRTQPADASFAPGKQIVKYLAKRDNEDENSYVGFAFLNGRTVQMWKRFAANAELKADAETLVDDPETAGEHYALESNHCYRCNHKLTVPASIYRGLGPECAKR